MKQYRICLIILSMMFCVNTEGNTENPTIKDQDKKTETWGQSVEGVKIAIIEAVQVQGRSDWPYPVVRLKLIAKNEGQRYLHLPENGLCWQIEVNGDWYEWVDPKLSNLSPPTTNPFSIGSGGILRDFNAGDFYVDLKVEIAGNWRKIPAGKETEYAQRQFGGSGWVVSDDDYGEELILKEGQTYQIRAAIPCPPSRSRRWDTLRPVSNPVEITIRPPSFSLEDLKKLISWGREVDGLQLGLRFDSPRNQYYQGEQVSFGVFACNTGDKTLNLVHFGFIGYTPTVFDANGKSKSVLGPIVDLPVRPHNLSLKPGDIKRVGSVSMKIAQKSDEAANDVTPYCNLEPGTYSIQQRFVFHENQQANWHGELSTGTLEMPVLTMGMTIKVDTAEIIRILENENIKSVSTDHSQDIYIHLTDGRKYTGAYVYTESGKYTHDPALVDILNLVMHIKTNRPEEETKNWLIMCE